MDPASKSQNHRPESSGWAKAALVTTNCVVIAGVLFDDWDAVTIVALYWVESVVVGLFRILKVIFGVPLKRDQSLLKTGIGKSLLIIVFTCHFGFIMFIHGIFLVAMFGSEFGENAAVDTPIELLVAVVQLNPSVTLATAILTLSHAFSFVANYIMRGEYLIPKLAFDMTAPYYRVGVFNLVIFFGGILVIVFQTPIWALIALIVSKVYIDLCFHEREHRRPQDQQTIVAQP